MSWSEQQLLAIETRNKNLLVAAAAGSGKTSVLVERIISRILDKEQPVDVDKVLVVTFTNAAAAEMRGRIGSALNDALKKQPRSEHIQRQLALLNSSAISTIHAFCQNIVRQNFHLLDLDPQFRIAGQAEVTIMKTEVLENLFEAKYAQGDEAFLDLVEHYGDEQSDNSLYQLVLGLYNFSQSHPWPEKWLAGLSQEFALPEAATVDQTPWSKLIREKIVLDLEQAGQQLDVLCLEAGRPGSIDAYVDTFMADRTVLDELLSAANHSWESLATAIAGCKFEKIAAVPKGTDESMKKYFQRVRQKVKDKINDCKVHFFDRPAEELLADMRLIAPVVDTLGKLVIEFGQEFAKAKRSKDVLDFNDLEHFCLQILLAPESQIGEIIPSSVAIQLQERFAEVMVDEYQDTNGVQETILRLVASTKQPNLFLVGDVKQSIYRFRLAEPELFMKKYRQYPTAGSQYARIDLSQNFRSRAGVLHAVNFLFAQLMSPRIGELEYGEAEKLNPGPDYPEEQGKLLEGPVELCIVDRDEAEEQMGSPEGEMDTGEGVETADGPAADLMEEAELSGFELEARLIAKKMSDFMTGNYRVYDKGLKEYRSLAWRDIVILLRSVKGKANVMLDVLRKAGIPAYAELDAGYFREIEVQIMVSLLSVIDNPRQDIALAAVLRSPLAGFTTEELAEVRLCCQGEELWSALSHEVDNASLIEETREKMKSFVKQLEQWRNLSRCKGVPELIWQIYRDTGYYDYVGGMPGGMLRQANLRALHDRARQYESTNFRGLFRFLRFVERMQDKGSDLAVARALGESENVVRIMSIHKSKGLEFPLVFVADLGKNINLQDSKALVLCHKALGVGPYVTNPELRFRYPTLARHGISHKLIMETKAEELRILYVALTRAREKLILVGSVSKLAKKAAGWCQYTERLQPTLPDSLIAGASNYLDWLCPAVARHEGGAALRAYGECEQELRPIFSKDPSKWQVDVYSRSQLLEVDEEQSEAAALLENIRNMQPVDSGEDYAWVEKTLGWQYGYQHIVGKPAKLSVTEIKRRFDTQVIESSQQNFAKKSIALRPRFIQQSVGLTGAERGTLMHSIMQQMDLQGDLSEGGIKEQIANMVAKEMILPEHADIVDSKGVVAFFQSSLGQRLCSSPKVRRELPFSLVLPAEKFYDDMAGAGEGIFIQGVIDALFDEDDGLVLLDYKTDWVTDSKELIERYTVQLNLYADAVERIFKQPVKEKYLYVFSTKEAVKL
ncbi:helicase-exonuclease AddAB subunit AddA [Pelosinus sp. IPA-1]|uniref:helicase-exonuclease AddAB subunit AddA n=1 Tax=Pelosinus sp. IPA-1 TaxID=3029569 RepID=UPI0024362AF5|nr:helicase-exonuclease AddAB subunit AddA [Pelosinus sp. IPA-1]GMA99839.1 ATP-dependent helicase/nuclease subunit A [Pelosinus sp. IPA-1]